MRKIIIYRILSSLIFLFIIIQFGIFQTNANNYPLSQLGVQYTNSCADVKVTAFIDNIAPQKNSTIFLTVTGPSGGKVTAISHFKNTTSVVPGIIGTDGIAVMPINVGNAESKFIVIVDVTVEYNGNTYKTTASFTPQ